jgi:hypothetical protein
MDLAESITPELQKVYLERIRPGEIWEISQRVHSPLEFDSQEQKTLYPDVARSFLEGNSPPRYVMIVKEPEPALAPEEEWRIVSVMLLSLKTDLLSNVDLLIPSQVSGFEQDLLAETWYVLPMLTCNLSHPVGRRLSRQVYDVLLDMGDHYHGLIALPPSIQEIQSLGLQAGAVSAKQQPEIQAFHEQEENWAAVLQVPVAAYRTYLKTMKVTDPIFEMALQLERELSEDEVIATVAPSKIPVHLSQWFQNIFERGWRTVKDLFSTQADNPAFSVRSAPQLREIEADNPATGVKRGKLIDLGIQQVGNPVALIVTLTPATDEEINIHLRVYPTGRQFYLPRNLQLIVLDATGATCLELQTQAKKTDNCLQLNLTGKPGEHFSVKVALGDISITENFVI